MQRFLGIGAAESKVCPPAHLSSLELSAAGKAAGVRATNAAFFTPMIVVVSDSPFSFGNSISLLQQSAPPIHRASRPLR